MTSAFLMWNYQINKISIRRITCCKQMIQSYRHTRDQQFFYVVLCLHIIYFAQEIVMKYFFYTKETRKKHLMTNCDKEYICIKQVILILFFKPWTICILQKSRPSPRFPNKMIYSRNAPCENNQISTFLLRVSMTTR